MKKKVCVLFACAAFAVSAFGSVAFFSNWQLKEARKWLRENFAEIGQYPLRERAQMFLKLRYDRRVNGDDLSTAKAYALYQWALFVYIRLDDFEGAKKVIDELTHFHRGLRACDILAMCRLSNDMETPEKEGRVKWLDELRVYALCEYRKVHEEEYQKLKRLYLDFLRRKNLIEQVYVPYDGTFDNDPDPRQLRPSSQLSYQFAFPRYTTGSVTWHTITWHPIKQGGLYSANISSRELRDVISDDDILMLRVCRDEIHQYECPEHRRGRGMWDGTVEDAREEAVGIIVDESKNARKTVRSNSAKDKDSSSVSSAKQSASKKKNTWSVMPRRRKIDPRLKRFLRPGEQW